MENNLVIFKYYSKKILFLMIGISILLINVNAFEGGVGTLGKNDLINAFNETEIHIRTNNVFNENIGNDKSGIGWDVADNTLSFINMYEATNDTSFLNSAYKYLNMTLDVRDDNRSVTTYLSKDSTNVILPLWRVLKYPSWYTGPSPKEDYMSVEEYFIRRYDASGNIINDTLPDECFAAPFLVLTGNIIQPMIHFAKILDRDFLWSHYSIERENYLNEIMSSIAAHNIEWFNFGTYKMYGWLDNDLIDLIFWRLQYHGRGLKNNPVSTNHFSSMGSALLRMYEINQDENCREKSYEIADAFKKILGINEEKNSFYWKCTYHDPNSGSRADDISHGRISYKFIYDYYNSSISENYPVFDSIDMKRLANTFMRNLFLGDIAHYEWVKSGDIYQWVYVEKDGYYDMNALVSGESYDESSSETSGYKYYINWARSATAFWIPLCEYDARVYEVAYNTCGPNSYHGIKNLLYYYDMYKPCIVSSSPDSVLCNYTEDLEIRFNNIKILGDLVVEVSQNNVVYYKDTMQQTRATDTIWNASLFLANFSTKYTDPIKVKYYSYNEGILGPMRIFEIPVIGDPLYIDHISEIPVLKNTNIEITVKTEFSPQDPDFPIIEPVPCCTVDMEYADGSINRGITDNDGKVIFENENIDNTKILSLTYYKGGCLTNYSNITPYMWSYSQNATGPNNGNNIKRDPDTGHLYMVYSLYDPYAEPNIPRTKRRIIGCYSENEGNWWQLEDIGYGRNPSIDKDSTSMEIFYDQITGYYYDNVELPNPVAVTNGSVHVEPGSMMADNINTLYLQAAGISYADNYTMKLTHMLIERNDPDNTIVTTLIDYLGLYAYNDPEYLIIPGHNPSIALELNYSSELNDRTIAFEDKNSEICQIRYNSLIPRWNPPERKSFSLDKISCNPYIDGYGDSTLLVWQEETGQGTDEYRIYLNNSRFIGDSTETDKRYPKVKRGSYISCVENKTGFIENTYNVKLYYFTPDGEGEERNIYTTEEEVYYPDFEVKTTEAAHKKRPI